jgi:predicted acetyltransferase
MQFTLGEALWVRLIDVGAALAARSLEDGSIVVDIRDELCPWNEGSWAIQDGAVERTTDEADLRLGVSELGSVYLGGLTFDQLLRAGRLEELEPGGAARADALFRTPREPWCPELF